jgi:FtsP/CotA-like multicopper oxidase with cupredoxin domain
LRFGLGLFTPREPVRLRIINASSMINFNFRIPGLAMTIVQADGQDIQPVDVDEFQIGIAETYDLIVRPSEQRAYRIIAEAIDRSGQCRATLAPRRGMAGDVPPLRERPILTMKDMGMDMPGMDHGTMKTHDKSLAPSRVKMGPGVATISSMPGDRIGDRPTGLENVDHRVLTYTDLKALLPNPDQRSPSRTLEIHLTANMERYMHGEDAARDGWGGWLRLFWFGWLCPPWRSMITAHMLA